MHLGSFFGNLNPLTLLSRNDPYCFDSVIMKHNTNHHYHYEHVTYMFDMPLVPV